MLTTHAMISLRWLLITQHTPEYDWWMRVDWNGQNQLKLMLVVKGQSYRLCFCHFRCAPGYQGNPMLPNGNCVPGREYEFNNCTNIFEKFSSRIESCTWIVLPVVHVSHAVTRPQGGLTLCNDYQQDFPCYSRRVVCGHSTGMQSCWNTPRCTFLPICHLLLSVLSLQKFPHVTAEEPSAPAAVRAAARLDAELQNQI